MSSDSVTGGELRPGRTERTGTVPPPSADEADGVVREQRLAARQLPRILRVAPLERAQRLAALDPRAPVKYRPCVRCGKMMNRMNFGQVSGTVVDVCRGHGTFLDTGELHAIVTFIRGGGLERARQRRLEELKEEERRLERKRHGPIERWHGEVRWSGDEGERAGRGLLDLLEMLKRKA